MTPSATAEVLELVRQRIRELEPLVEEYKRLRLADEALEGAEAEVAARTAPAPTVRPSRTTRRRNTGVRPARRGRPPGSGRRAEEALALLETLGPLTIVELAGHMGIKPNYLYRVLPGLEADGKVRKRRNDRRYIAQAATR